MSEALSTNLRVAGFSIGKKILCVALLLVALMIVIGGTSILLVSHVRSELEMQARVFVPLANEISTVEAMVLDIEVHNERLHLALHRREAGMDDGRAKELEAGLRGMHGRLREAVGRADGLLTARSLSGFDKTAAIEIARATAVFETIKEEISAYERSSARLLEAHMEGREEDALNLAALTEENEEKLYKHLDGLRLELQGHMQSSLDRVVGMDEILSWAIAALTLVAALLGFLLSSVIARGIVRPIRELMAGMSQVREGNLEAHVQPTTKDEAAWLTEGFNEMVEGLKAKEQISETFGRYVDPRIAETLISDPDSSKPGGDRRDMTVFFSDLEGFTSLSETLSPAALVNLLNGYFGEMADAVHQRDGVIDKFIGDAVMAYWGEPFVPAGSQGEEAVASGLDQLERLKEFRKQVPEILGIRRNVPEINMRIGIATGPALIGSVGSDSHRNYTVMGDTVNLASRLEGACKAYGIHMLVDEATRELCDKLAFREIDYLRVKGKEEPIRVFQPLGLQPTPEAVDNGGLFEDGLNAYRNQEFDQAEKKFRKALEALPSDPAARVFLDRLALMREDTPGTGWDGVWVMTSK